jgi:hypothetical protein
VFPTHGSCGGSAGTGAYELRATVSRHGATTMPSMTSMPSRFNERHIDAAMFQQVEEKVNDVAASPKGTVALK